MHGSNMCASYSSTQVVIAISSGESEFHAIVKATARGLGFVALPNVFAQMTGGQVFGFLWFFMLFIAAVTSSVSMLQPVIAFLEEGFNLRRRDSAAFLGLLAAIGCGVTLYLSKGLVALDTMDFWVGSVMIFVLALIQSILYGWAMGIVKGEEEAHKGANIRIPRFVQYMLKFVVPVYLLVIFIAFCINNAPGYLEQISKTPAALASVLFIMVITGFLLMLIRIAGRRWEREGRLTFGPEPAPTVATPVSEEEV